MNRTTTIPRQVVYEGYGFETHDGMEYAAIDGKWQVFGRSGESYPLDFGEAIILGEVFEIKPLPEVTK